MRWKKMKRRVRLATCIPLNYQRNGNLPPEQLKTKKHYI